MTKKIDVTALRVLRKGSHIAGKVFNKSGRILRKVEDKTTRIIINKTGSPDGRGSVGVNSLIYRTYPQIIPVHPALPVIGQRPSITVFAFLDPRGFYGGIATLLCVAAEMAIQKGYDLRIAQTTGYSAQADVLGFLESKGFSLPKDRYSTIDLSKRTVDNFGYLPLHEDDILVVSAWWDAHIAEQLPLKNKFLYLIQDFEPIFYNNSDLSVLADQTYVSEKFIPLLNTEILYRFFEKNGYTYIAKNATWFEPAPAPQADASIKKDKNTKTIFIYGRPHVHRNLYYNALKALDLALQDEKTEGINYKLYSAGAADIPSVKLTSGHVVTNLGKMKMDDYYKFAQTIDVAISPMLAPHPNYPTLELASLGAAVVSTSWRTKQDLSYYSPNILMAQPSPEAMSEKIIEAILMPEDEKQKNKKQNHIDSDWPKALSQPVKKALNKITKKD